MPEFHLPGTDEHLSVIGQNGSGKTQLAAWVLSRAAFDRMPWVIIDYKREQLFSRVPGIKLLGSFRGHPPWKVPKHPGVYILQPEPWEKSELEDFLYTVWRKGKCGVYIDEAHMLPKQDEGAFQALLTQGRSKKIPMIVLTQKPSWVSRFIFSEAKYFSIFHLNDRRDKKTVEEFAPIDLDEPLEQFHSYWFDTSQRHTFLLDPVPDASKIISDINARLPRQSGFGVGLFRNRLKSFAG